MKKPIIFLIIALFAATSFSVSKTVKELNAGKSSLKPPRIHIDFIVAKPKSDCNSFPGVCKPTLSIGEGRMYNGLEAGAYLQYENGKLTMELSQMELGETAISSLSKISIFNISEITPLSPEILKALNAPQESGIMIGKYPIRKTENGYIIVLNMQ